MSVSLPESIQINNRIGGLSTPIKTEKWWGYELTYINDQYIGYCSKLLYIEPGGHTSMHFHVSKHETLVVVDGELTLEIIDNKETKTYILKPQDAWIMIPGIPHKLIAKDHPVTIVESSTIDREDDSVRIS
jgi:mannose-6-phosphate isomerase-like protein (cupin superfamily)